MNQIRRYSEAEVAEILERATSSDHALARPQAGEGLTLEQLQEIGAEVGISPASIARAAEGLSARGVAQPAPTVLGQPRSVSRIVPIDRALTDDEWTRLVVDLRETFGAKGEIQIHGALRSWTNGNLQVHVEPDGARYRVRMRTVKGNASSIAYSGAFAVVVGAVLLASAALGGRADVGAMVASGLVGAMGLGQIGYVRRMLPRWADRRARQMEGLAERIPRLLEAGER